VEIEDGIVALGHMRAHPGRELGRVARQPVLKVGCPPDVLAPQPGDHRQPWIVTDDAVREPQGRHAAAQLRDQGWEAFRLNVNPLASLAGTNPQPRSRGSRGFAGIRLRGPGRSAVPFRGRQGDRLANPMQAGWV